MDIWKYYYITHKKHLICNPMSGQKIERLFSVIDLKHKARVLDIACGKGEPLVMLVEQYGISGIGVDMSPYYIQECREKKAKRIPGDDIEILEMDGATYKPENNEAFDLCMCLGASFVFGNFNNTLSVLKGFTKKDGYIIVGEPYWLKEPESKYLEIAGFEKEMFGTHLGNIEIAEKQELTCLYTTASNLDDWDHYETLQWLAAYDYVAQNPGDADNKELIDKINKVKYEYLKYGRDTVGWAIYVFKKAAYILK